MLGLLDAGCQMVHIEQIPARAARYGEPARPLSAPVQTALTARGITRLFSHQAEALNAVLAGDTLPLYCAKLQASEME